MSRREGHVEHAGGRTWYRVVGEAAAGRAPLLCLHGGPGSTHHYFAPLERLARDGRTVVVYDQVGCGRSEKRADVAWSLRLFLDELDALRAALGLERVHLLGTSWGGMLALEHALRRPGTLAGLILSSTLACAADWEAEARRLRDDLPADVRAVLDRHEAAGTFDDPEYEAAIDVFDARHFHRGEPRPELERMRRERSLEAYRAMWGPNEWTLRGALSGWDVRPRLAELDVPTLVLRGRHDLCTDAIAAPLVGIRGAREVLLEHSSHTPVLEETERYLELVGGFLDASEEGVTQRAGPGDRAPSTSRRRPPTRADTP
ncbi:MAG TPA: proline iminopeptidase-family hydrolase [Gaiellaceae bacterium]|nr:proline iminopeptidase-family hydrolase [Gaiellaceae bacterium]